MKYSLGLAQDGLKFGVIPEDGGVATVFANPGKVHENTLKVTPAAPTVNNFFAEGFPDPAISLSKRGIKDFAANLLTVDPEVAADLTGGTIAGGIYSEPIDNVIIERSVQIEDLQGTIYTYPRVQLSVDVVGEFTTTAPNVLRITGVVLLPLKAGLSAFSFGKPVAP